MQVGAPDGGGGALHGRHARRSSTDGARGGRGRRARLHGRHRLHGRRLRVGEEEAGVAVRGTNRGRGSWVFMPTEL